MQCVHINVAKNMLAISVLFLESTVSFLDITCFVLICSDTLDDLFTFRKSILILFFLNFGLWVNHYALTSRVG